MSEPAGRYAAVTSTAYEVPTDAPESDGTLEWDSTTMVAVTVQAGGQSGLGYTYGHPVIAELVGSKLVAVVAGRDALDVEGSWVARHEAVRNLGRPGLSAMAIAAVDVALWDLKARLLDLPLVELLGQVRSKTGAYGSGGFSSYSVERLRGQLGGGFVKASALCEAYGLPLSAHTAPALHAHVCCACPPVVHIEYFHDHARIEGMLLDGAPSLKSGSLVPDLTRPGMGWELKQQDAEKFIVKGTRTAEGRRQQ